MTDPIEAVLNGRYRLNETEGVFRCPIKSLVIAPGLADQAKDLLGGLGDIGKPVLVADPNTFEALGQRLASCLPFADTVVLPAPEATDTDADDLMDRTRHADTLIAVGSGTLNDLCKKVSHQRGRPYLVFPTAPSMNGYTTATASISVGGEKLSLPAAPPLGMFLDLDVLAAAPRRLIRAGVGDSLCRSTAEVDWLLSHLLLDTAYQASPFLLQTDAEADLLNRASQLLDGDLEAMQALVRLLVLGGLGMLMVGNSQPGSQGEHLISHYIDMICRPHPGTLHGEQVGLATWTMASLQQAILNMPGPPVLGETVIDEASMTKRFGTLGPACQKALKAKAMTGQKLDLMNQRLAQNWPALRDRLNAVALPRGDLKTAFKAADVPMDAEALGLNSTFYSEAVRHARELRDRFTMLDLAADAGLLDPFIDQHLPLRP